MSNRILLTVAAALLIAAWTGAQAASPDDLLQSYAAQAKQANASFKEFSPTAGDKFYHAAVPHSSGKPISCATCHTGNPKNAGKHEKTGKEILPLAPAVNKARFSDLATTEKWFLRNCQDVLERACTVQEKGDFITYVLSIK